MKYLTTLLVLGTLLQGIVAPPVTEKKKEEKKDDDKTDRFVSRNELSCQSKLSVEVVTMFLLYCSRFNGLQSLDVMVVNQMK